jgi:hypothetical protein
VIARPKIGWVLTLAAASGVVWLLRQLLRDDPELRRLLVGPKDDEPITAEDVAAVRAADERIRGGHYVPEEEVFPGLSARP